MIQVKVVDVVNVKESSDAYSHFVVMLLDEAGQRVLPIWVGKYEGESIALGIREFATVRPMTFNFMAKLLEASGTSLEEVRVESLKNDTFYGIAKLRMGDKTQEVDARPSDVIALAVRTGAPIFVAPDVMEKAAKPVPPNANAVGNGLSSIVKDVEGQVAIARAIINTSQEDQEKTQAELLKFVFGS